MMRRGPDPSDAVPMLDRALVASAAAVGLAACVLDHRSVAWSSATFVGERHCLTLGLTGEPAAWLADLSEAEFALRGHLVVDLHVVGIDGEGVATLEVLTLVKS